MAATHHYRVQCTWSGSTGVGYDDYDRGHRVSVERSATELALSADPAFRGDPEQLNPEQLLVAAAASCQLLSFLAVAARARIDVIAYADTAEAIMPEDDPPVRITWIVLHPNITVRTGPDEQRVRRLVEIAHRECFIANSLTSTIEIDPTIRFV